MSQAERQVVETDHWDGDHPGAIECSRDGCESVEFNIVHMGRDPRHPVAICKHCGRVRLDGGQREKPFR